MRSLYVLRVQFGRSRKAELKKSKTVNVNVDTQGKRRLIDKLEGNAAMPLYLAMPGASAA